MIKFKGRIGDLSFYKDRNGYQARMAGGVDAQRIATDPKFQRTRENGAEFGLAVKSAKQMRDALRPVTTQQSDVRMSNRLSGRMVKVVKADTVNDRGQRQVLGANTPLLKGFNFNNASQLSNTLYVNLTSSIDRATGALQVSVEAFDPKTGMALPSGATHFQFTAAGLTLDFAGDAKELVKVESALFAVGDVLAAATVLDIAMTAAATTPIFLLFGIAFYQQVNTKTYPLQNGAFNVLVILDVNGE